jgi:hypothetical protein
MSKKVNSARKRFINKIHETFAIPKSDVDIMYDIFTECLTDTLLREEKVIIDKFCTLTVERKGVILKFDFWANDALKKTIRETDWKKLRDEEYGVDE